MSIDVDSCYRSPLFQGISLGMWVMLQINRWSFAEVLFLQESATKRSLPSILDAFHQCARSLCTNSIGHLFSTSWNLRKIRVSETSQKTRHLQWTHTSGTQTWSSGGWWWQPSTHGSADVERFAACNHWLMACSLQMKARWWTGVWLPEPYIYIIIIIIYI